MFHVLSTILATVDQDSFNYVIHPLLQNSTQDNDLKRLWALEKHFYPPGKLLFYALRMNPGEKPETFFARVMEKMRAINQLVDKEHPEWRRKLELSMQTQMMMPMTSSSSSLSSFLSTQT